MKIGFFLASLAFAATLIVAFIFPGGSDISSGLSIQAGVIPGGGAKKAKSTNKNTSKLPNIVFVLSDDQDSHSLRAQKKLTQFFENGGRIFPNHFLTTPVCCPSRESFFTGKYTHNHQVYSNRIFPFKNVNRPLGGAPLAQSKNASIASSLQKRGYYTSLVGKYLNGFSARSKAPAGWNEIFSMLGEESQSSYYNFSTRSKKRIFSFGNRPKDYSGRVLTRAALGSIERAQKARKPFFVQISYPAPHLGSDGGAAPDPDPRDIGAWEEQFSGEKCLSGAVNEADVSDKPERIRSLPLLDNISELEEICKSRWESLLSIEREFFRIAQKTKEMGEFKDTIFIYTTDNGFFLGQHRIAKGKFLPYEESVRFPLFVKGPGVPAGRSLRMVANIDFYPTILALSRARGGGYDGSHAWKSSERRVVLLEHFVKSRQSPPYRALRTKRYLWVKYYTPAPPWRSRPSGEEELYDLYRDPYQKNNLLSSGRMTAAPWINRLKALSSCAGDSCRALSTRPLPAPRFQDFQDPNRAAQKKASRAQGPPPGPWRPKRPVQSSR